MKPMSAITGMKRRSVEVDKRPSSSSKLARTSRRMGSLSVKGKGPPRVTNQEIHEEQEDPRKGILEHEEAPTEQVSDPVAADMSEIREPIVLVKF